MKLSQHLKAVLENADQDAANERYEELVPKIKEWRSIFSSGIGQNYLQVSADGSISYNGSILFSEDTRIDGSVLPFKFKRVSGELTMDADFADNLDSLDGLPKEYCGNLNICCTQHKPAEFFKGKFPFEVDKLTIAVHSLDDCDFGIKYINDSAEIEVSKAGRIKSLKGFPNVLRKLILNVSPDLIDTFNGMPQNLQNLEFWPTYSNEGYIPFKLHDLVENSGAINEIYTSQSHVTNNEPLLKLLTIKGLKALSCAYDLDPRTDSLSLSPIFDILTKHIGGDMLDCQDALIDAGFEQIAKIK